MRKLVGIYLADTERRKIDSALRKYNYEKEKNLNRSQFIRMVMLDWIKSHLKRQ